MDTMRISNAVHEAHPWRIREIASDFRLEDVWALPVEGGRDEFQSVLDNIAALDPADSDSKLADALWWLRDQLGRWFGLGQVSTGPDVGELAIPGTAETSLAARLPADLRGTGATAGVDFGRLPFVPLYRTDDEFAAEISNATVHGVLHLAWVDQGGGRYAGQMAVYVKPRGTFGRAYMAAIKPFRYLVVYPALMRQIERVSRASRTPRPAT